MLGTTAQTFSSTFCLLCLPSDFIEEKNASLVFKHCIAKVAVEKQQAAVVVVSVAKDASCSCPTEMP